VNEGEHAPSPCVKATWPTPAVCSLPHPHLPSHSLTQTHKPTCVPRSSGTFYQRGHDDVIRAIEARVAAASLMPVENQEGLQLLHYQDGEKYGEHGEGGCVGWAQGWPSWWMGRRAEWGEMVTSIV
jgi:hypothetical protein